jgi:radical SAM protein with 4Fe4S-binding SPASM domain
MPNRRLFSLADPVPVPMAFHVEPTNVCNFRCGICPEALSDYKGRAGYYSYMSPETWEIVRPQLAAMHPEVVRFYHIGEPLLNPRLGEMIASVRNDIKRLEITTNGSLLTEQRGVELIEAGITQMSVSVYSTTDEGYRRATGSRFTLRQIIGNLASFRRVRDNLRACNVEIVARLVSENPWDFIGQAIVFRKLFSPLADKVLVKIIHNWTGGEFINIDNVPPERYGVPGKPVGAEDIHPDPTRPCSIPFYQLAIKANGVVTVCCADWENALALGDLTKGDTLESIWAGEKLRRLQVAHATGRRCDIPACKDCTVLLEYPDEVIRA